MMFLFPQIIHYELPNNSESFVHRSGRTGRAGKKGTAILMYTMDQSRAVKGIERDVGCKFREVNFFLLLFATCLSWEFHGWLHIK